MKTALLKAVYKGINMKPNGIYELTILAGYSQLEETYALGEMLQLPIVLKLRIDDAKPFNAGEVRFKQMSLSEIGEIKIKVYGMITSSNIGNLTKLTSINTDEVLMVRFEQEETEAERDA